MVPSVSMYKWLTGIHFISDLKRLGFYVTETVCTNGKGLGKRVTIIKSEEYTVKIFLDSKEIGHSAVSVYIGWFDKRDTSSAFAQ